MDAKNVFQKDFNSFIKTHVCKVYQNILLTNSRLAEVKKKKASQAEKLINEGYEYFIYEELENEYITILTEEVYKQSIKDFLELISTGKEKFLF